MPKQPATRGVISCSDCGRWYTRHSDLTRHIQAVHEGLKPFPCTHCGKDFGQKSNMTRHLRSCAAARQAQPTHDAIPALSYSPSSQSSSSSSSSSPSPSSLRNTSARPIAYKAPVLSPPAPAPMAPPAPPRRTVNPQAMRASLHHKRPATGKPTSADAPLDMTSDFARYSGLCAGATVGHSQYASAPWTDFVTANQPIPLQGPFLSSQEPFLSLQSPPSQPLNGSYPAYLQYPQPSSGSGYPATGVNDETFLSQRMDDWLTQSYSSNGGQGAQPLGQWGSSF